MDADIFGNEFPSFDLIGCILHGFLVVAVGVVEGVRGEHCSG